MFWPPNGRYGPDTAAGLAVEAYGLIKHYGDQTVLSGVDLALRQGVVLGVLGPNGAGKTTLVRILSTLAKADGGTALVGGFDVRRQPDHVRRTIGLTGQYASVDEKLSGFENLYMIGRLLDLSRRQARARATELLERFSLTDAASRKARTYSGGMRRRLDLASGMVGRPSVLFLDEPTTGLDPHTRNEVWDEVASLAREGTAVLLTTQYMEEAERLADELTVIDHGRVIARGSIAELKTQVGAETLQIRPLHHADLGPMLSCLRLAGIAGAWIDEAEGQLMVAGVNDRQLSCVMRSLGTAGFEVAALTTHQPSLDDVFLTLTGHKAGAVPRPAVDLTGTMPIEGTTPGTTAMAAAPAYGTVPAPAPYAYHQQRPSHPSMTGPGAPPPLDPGWYYARPATQPPTAPPPRPAHRTPGAHLRHTGTLVRRNLLHMRDDPSSLLDSVLMPGIFTVLFVYVFGGAIAGSRAGYIQYMIPGLLGILSLMLATSVSTGMNTDFQTGLMDRFRTLPISPVSVLAARLISETVRSLLSLSVLMNFAMLLGMRVPAGPLVVLAVDGLIILFGTAMVWISMLVGMSMRSAQSAQAVSGLVAVPLQFGSSIFAPVSTMPDWLVSFTRYNPLSALADACRELINEKPAGHSVLVVLIWSCGITVVAAPLALARFRKRT